MIELGPVGLFRTIITLVIIYYGGKFLFKWWLKRKVNAAVRRQQNTVSENEVNSQRQGTGRVHIKSDTSSSTHNSSGGDYVDYEDVD
jgi:hypothetical protein